MRKTLRMFPASTLLLALVCTVAGPVSGDRTAKEGPRVPFSNFKELDTYVSELTDKNEFSGVVLAAKDGAVQFKKAYGYANKSYDVPNLVDTKFNLGSLNKSFTSVAITQLIQQDKLKLDDSIGKYLSGFSNEASKNVTIKHLLLMRSGWGDYWGNETYLAKRNDLRTVSDYIDFLKDLPLDFEPGTDMQHSNTSFEVLGAIIEKVTGEDYYDYVRENIFRRADMKNTDSFHRDELVKNLAMGYTNMNPNDRLVEGHLWTNVYMLPPRGTPAGGGYSTAEDLLKYVTALRNHILLDRYHTDLLFGRFEPREKGADSPGGRIGMAGGAPGVNTFLGIDLDEGYTVIVLSNYDMPVAMELGRGILKMMAE